MTGRGKVYRDRCQIQRHVYGNFTQIGYIGILVPQNLKKPRTSVHAVNSIPCAKTGKWCAQDSSIHI